MIAVAIRARENQYLSPSDALLADPGKGRCYHAAQHEPARMLNPQGPRPMTDALIRDAMRVLDRYAVTLPPLPTLQSVRQALDPFIFDGEVCKDDVAEICQRLDDLLTESLDGAH